MKSVTEIEPGTVRQTKPAKRTVVMRAIVATALLCAGHAIGQTATNTLAVTNAPPASAASRPAAVNEAETRWSFSASAYSYVVPDGQDYVQPTFTADRGWLHLEARYNYEDQDTGSAWLGYNLSGGKEITWELTPMLGAVFGNTTGIAPGYKGSVSWWKLELYSEGEYVVDTRDSADSFFYNWSELSIAPVDWLRLGLVTQRTRAYQTDRDVQRGFLAGFYFNKVNFTGYVLNPDDNKPVFLFAVGFNF